MDRQTVVEVTRRWISSVVIGLNLCPFARRVFEQETIRYVVSEAADGVVLLDELAAELRLLASSPIDTIETTLLIHPLALNDFLDYNDFLGETEKLLKRLKLRGVIQIASFHPLYQFANTQPDDVENYTNRSPHPMLHLLREASIDALDVDEDELLSIPERNVELLRRLGREKLVAMLDAARASADRIEPSP